MARFKITTTVDITRTNPDRECKDSVVLAQQANFNSLLQGIGMRANIIWNSDPIQKDNGKHNIWEWEFETEYKDVFLKDGDPAGLLKDDLSGVPVIKNLNNTDLLEKPMFIATGDLQNIWISSI
jgi:hypothetical protein